MISRIVCIVVTVMWSLFTMAQAPKKMSYQMVVRNSTNAIVANQQVGVKITLLQGSATGTVVYEETHAPTTNANGLTSLVIGDGTVVTGNIANINWTNGPYFIKTDTDPAGGTNYSITGTSQLLSVPYALHAETAGSIKGLGKTYIVFEGHITDTEAAAILERDAGPNTQFVWVHNTTGLTTLNFSGVTELIELLVGSNQDLVNITFPNLKSVYSKFVISNNPNLLHLPFPQLVKLNSGSSYSFVTSNPAIQTISFPMLESAFALEINANTSLVTLSAPQLRRIVFQIMVKKTGLASLSLPMLEGSAFNYLKFIENSQLTTLSLPSVKNLDQLQILDNRLLNSISVPELLNVNMLEIKHNIALPLINFTKLKSAVINLDQDSALAVISFPQLKTTTFTISKSPALTLVDLPELDTAHSLNVSNVGNALFSLPKLVRSGTFSFQNSQVTSLAAPLLKQITTLSLTTNSLTAVSFPQLQKIGTVNISDVSLGSISLPELDTTGAFNLNTCPMITNISFPKLNHVTAWMAITSNSQLTSIAIPLLQSFGTLPYPIQYNLSFRNNNLPSSQVNTHLNHFASNPLISNLKFDFRQLPPAPPTGQGIIDKTTLQSRQNTVTTD